MDFLVHHMLRASTLRDANKEALVFQFQRFSYGDMWEKTGQIAGSLQQLGTGKRDRVGIYLEPCLELPLAIFGISRAGGVFVPIHHSLRAEQVKHIVGDCQMKGLITSRANFEAIRDQLFELPALEFVLLTDDELSHDDQLRLHTMDECQTHNPEDLHDHGVVGQDLAAILYTSGSTGKPKGVMLSHANVLAGASIVSEYLQITSSDRLLAALPFSFDAGMNQLTTAIQQGGTIVMTKFLFARDLVKQLVEENITGLAGVPSLWNLLAQPSSGLASTGLPHLRYITNTGGAMPRSLTETLREALPDTQVFLMYGLTEAFRSTYLPPDQLDLRAESIGKAIPNTEILVVNEDGQPCGPGEEGELVHAGPTVSLGYWGHPELTQRVLRPHPFPPLGSPDLPNVCYSGDLVRMDEEGFLYFIGRRDNQLKSSGFRISPTEVEEILCRCGNLQEVAVIGLPDEVLGQVIKAFVVPAEETELDPDAILAACARLAPRHMIPRHIEVLDALPKTSSGKVNYPALRDREQCVAS